MTEMSLKQQVIDELDWEPSVDAAHIGVTVRDGLVTLTGHVSSYAEKLAAERAAWRVKGVKALAEEIEVQLPSAYKIDDENIARRAANALSWHVNVPDDRVKVMARNGWITLTGEVDWQYQRRAAENAVRVFSGVKGVHNEITIKAQAQPTDVKKRIQSALARHASREANNIRIEIKDGRVTLEGDVNSWHDRRLAEDAAWAAPGVNDVDDRIRVV